MELNSFKNKVVIKTATGERLYLIEITSPELKTVTVEKGQGGQPCSLCGGSIPSSLHRR